MVITRIYENLILLSQQLVSFLVGLRTYQHPRTCILFGGRNISFDASLVIYIYINSANIPPIMIITKIYETQNLLSLQLFPFLVGLWTYKHDCTQQQIQFRNFHSRVAKTVVVRKSLITQKLRALMVIYLIIYSIVMHAQCKFLLFLLQPKRR